MIYTRAWVCAAVVLVVCRETCHANYRGERGLVAPVRTASRDLPHQMICLCFSSSFPRSHVFFSRDSRKTTTDKRLILRIVTTSLRFDARSVTITAQMARLNSFDSWQLSILLFTAVNCRTWTSGVEWGAEARLSIILISNKSRLYAWIFITS